MLRAFEYCSCSRAYSICFLICLTVISSCGSFILLGEISAELRHEEMTVKQMRKQMEYALEHEQYSKARNIAGDGHST